MSFGRIHSAATPEFFRTFVVMYPNKQYQAWLGREHMNVHVGFDYSYDKQLLDKLSASMINHFNGLSFSRALTIARNSQRDNPIPIFDSVDNLFHLTSSAFLQTRRPNNLLRDEHKGIIHAELFLLRLLSSFEAARRLINWGFFVEPLTILRSSLEQLSWAYAVGVNFDRAQLDNPTPTKCVGKFRERFVAAGLLYGALSRFSHMDFEGQKHFVIKEETGAGIMAQSTEFKFFGLLFYSFLLIAYQLVCRDLREFYSSRCCFDLDLKNIVLPLKHLVGHALMRAELDRDEIAATLSLIYFNTFAPRAK
jgi:hypothetical protein